jgi:hypothetical protein
MRFIPAFALAAILTSAGCAPKDEKTEQRTTPPVKKTVSASDSDAFPFDSTRFRLHIGSFDIQPGGWVDSTPFAAQDSSEPNVLGDSVTDSGLRIRSWLHQAKGFTWISTNQGMSSPDGPYWISQIATESEGAAFDTASTVGHRFPGSLLDTEVVLRRGNLERTVMVRRGLITGLILVAANPPKASTFSE